MYKCVPNNCQCCIQKRHTLRKGSELSIKNFYCVFVCTENNLIAFLGPSNCVNTQYAALSGAIVSLKLYCYIYCIVLTNSKFGLFYSNFLILTPTFSQVPIENYGKTPTFSGKQHFYSYFQNPGENSVIESLSVFCEHKQETKVPFLAIFGTFSRKSSEINPRT